MVRARRRIGPSYRANETPLLVGIVNRVKDWNLVKTEHWYRIPVKSAPAQLHAMEYPAFYLTKSLQDEKWAVTYYARITGMVTVPRRELLPDEPDHKRAGEPYYRIDIGELQRLPQPIPSRRWRRIIFIPTTLEKLLNAEEINDLFHTSPIEDRLHGVLKRADVPAERQYLVREPEAGYMLDFALFCRDGNLDVECDGDWYHLISNFVFFLFFAPGVERLMAWRCDAGYSASIPAALITRPHFSVSLRWNCASPSGEVV